MPEDNEIANTENMKTQLVIRQPKVTGGRAIYVKEMPTNNYMLHPVGLMVSGIQIASIEGDSNNMKAHVIPSEVADLRAQWRAAVSLIDDGFTNNDRPRTSLEQQMILLATGPRELLKIFNLRIQMVNIELDRYLRILFSQDGSSTQAFFDSRMKEMEKKARQNVINSMDKWWGDGAGKAATMKVVPFAHVGTLTPPLDRNLSYYKEASANEQPVGHKDVEDKGPDSTEIA